MDGRNLFQTPPPPSHRSHKPRRMSGVKRKRGVQTRCRGGVGPEPQTPTCAEGKQARTRCATYGALTGALMTNRVWCAHTHVESDIHSDGEAEAVRTQEALFSELNDQGAPEEIRNRQRPRTVSPCGSMGNCCKLLVDMASRSLSGFPGPSVLQYSSPQDTPFRMREEDTLCWPTN